MTQKNYTDPITNMEFVLIKGGTFQMGAIFEDANPDEYPLHEVVLDDFYLGKYPVTQKQWRTLINNNPSMFKKGDDYPVEMVSWNESKIFIKALCEKTGLTFRLPTEAEWEYAARGGGNAHKWSGTNDESELGKYAWYEVNSGWTTHPIGQKVPNECGICELSGSVHEWVEDVYDPNSYKLSDNKNPIYQGPGQYKGFRGGSWKRHAIGVRTTRRFGAWPTVKFGTFGLRLARTV